MEELKARTEAIRHRQDLEHRNMNVALVLVTSVTGYLVVYASSKGLPRLFEGEVALLIPVTSLLLSTFHLRQLDHEVNIADYGAYVRSVLRPRIAQLVGRDVLQYEIFIDEVRRSRTRRLAGVLLLGNEAFQLLVLSLVAATLSLITEITWSKPAGDGGTAFTFSTGLALLFIVVSVWQTREMVRHYRTVDRVVESWREAH
ncbi:hypothetical protein [Phycicoccus sp. 3266]|uniref:hypothetical protein n=1 Tax=Phycicoccus sp. 3266 TaxID=2817751 RepID=UPI00286386CB|nr:hypothetical protein [Phycicoccus sp. 3266]MDR6862430.1 hypothetical protein [Phycicoccus sp. 3266]